MRMCVGSHALGLVCPMVIIIFYIYIYLGYIYTPTPTDHTTYFFFVLSCHVRSVLLFSLVSYRASSVACFPNRTGVHASQSASCLTLIYRWITVNTILTHRLLRCRCLFRLFIFVVLWSLLLFPIYMFYIYCTLYPYQRAPPLSGWAVF